METALRAIGYSAVVAGGFALFLAAFGGVFFAAAEAAYQMGVSHKNAPLFGFLAWGVIGSACIGTGIALEQRNKESSDAVA